MDDNKLKVLQSLSYEIPQQCGLCRHAIITKDAFWGVCTLHEYDHEKHTGPSRKLSIFRGGVCNKFETANESKLATQLGTWREFLRA